MAVPVGLPFAAKVTEMLVVNTLKPDKVGTLTSETVATLAVKLPAIPLKFCAWTLNAVVQLAGTELDTERPVVEAWMSVTPGEVKSADVANWMR